LRPLTFYFQKTMVPVGPMEKPLLEYVVRLLTYHGFDRIIMLTNYRANQIVNYFDETQETSGTGGALLNARDLLERDFIVYYGDILSSIDLGKMWSEHISAGAACTVALAKDYPIRVGVAELGPDGGLKGFVEKPMLGRPVSIGIFCANKRIIDVIDDLRREKRSEGEKLNIDLTADVIPSLIERGDVVKGFLTDSFWYDVGSLERYEKLSNDVVEKELSFLFSH